MKEDFDVKCWICGKKLKYVHSGNDLHYLCCPNGKRNHILEIGPYISKAGLIYAVKKMFDKEK